MELAFVFLFCGIMYGIITIMSIYGGMNRTRCDSRGVRHVWEIEESNGKKYRICNDCKWIPENDPVDDSERGKYDF